VLIVGRYLWQNQEKENLMPKQSFTVKIPEGLNPAQRDDFIDEVIDYIKGRTKEGTGVKKTGRGFSLVSFPAYSKEYGKKGTVDLTVDGDMLDSIEAFNKKRTSAEIGYKSNNPQAGKAEGNITGSYGKSPNKKKARNFLGLNAQEIKALEDFVKGKQ